MLAFFVFVLQFYTIIETSIEHAWYLNNKYYMPQVNKLNVYTERHYIK